MKSWGRWATYTKSLQIVSQQRIKDPDTMANLVRANTYISGYVIMHDSVGIIIGYAERKHFILVCVHSLHNWQKYIGMQ